MVSRQFLSPQFIRFIASGGIAALANFFSRLFFEHYCGLDYGVAIVLAYLVGMAVAFVLFRRHVFEPSQQHPAREIAQFAIVNLFSVLQTLLVSLALADYLLPALHIDGMRKEIAHAIGIIIPTFTSFLGHKYFTFRNSTGSPGEPLP